MVAGVSPLVFSDATLPSPLGREEAKVSSSPSYTPSVSQKAETWIEPAGPEGGLSTSYRTVTTSPTTADRFTEGAATLTTGNLSPGVGLPGSIGQPCPKSNGRHVSNPAIKTKASRDREWRFINSYSTDT